LQTVVANLVAFNALPWQLAFQVLAVEEVVLDFKDIYTSNRQNLKAFDVISSLHKIMR
jgi:hypothetical protein